MSTQLHLGGKLLQARLALSVNKVQIGNVLDLVRTRLVAPDSLKTVKGEMAQIALPCLVTLATVINIRVTKFAKDRGLKTVKGFTISLYTL